MKESFELSAMKGEMMELLTYDHRYAAICMLYNIMAYAHKHCSISVFEIFDLNRKPIDHSWDEYGWTAEDLICNARPGILKTEDGKYMVFIDFHYMKYQGDDHSNKLYNWPTDIFDKPIVKKEELNEKPKEPKKHHEYSISGDSSYRIGQQYGGQIGKNGYLTYAIHVDTTNPDVYHEIYNMANYIIETAQLKEE